MEIQKKKFIRFVFSLIATIIIFVFIFIFYKISFLDILEKIKTADFRIVLFTLCISIISNFLISAYRWKLILKHLDSPISLKESLLIKLGSDPLISLLPFKSGEFSRLLYLKRFRNISYFSSFFSVAGEYILNISALLFSIFVGIIIYLSQRHNFILSAGVCIIPLGLAIFMWPKWNLHRGLPHEAQGSYYSLFRIYLKRLKVSLRNKVVLLCTFLFTIAELSNIYLLSQALYNPLPLYKILIYAPLIIIASSLPITIMGLGVREMAVTFFFLRFAPPEVLLSLGILYTFVEHIFPMIIGACATGLFLNRIFWGRNERS
ncbi:MAG: flippase-like domain-containing protein [Candidatus Omnitrophica bacterium]|nr:flippase-like domain-containing protein [Candidatus Omnitrophota bacterium]